MEARISTSNQAKQGLLSKSTKEAEDDKVLESVEEDVNENEMIFEVHKPQEIFDCKY